MSDILYVNRACLCCLIVLTICMTGCVQNPKPPLNIYGLSIQDTETGLVWARNVNEGEKAIAEYKGVIFPQYQGTNTNYSLPYTDAQALLGLLNKEKYGGYDDWRLPALHEVKRLYDMAKDFDGRQQYRYSTLGFVGACGYYWTSTPNAHDNMQQIGTCPWYKLNGPVADVWPVRGAEVKLPYTKRVMATAIAPAQGTQSIKKTKQVRPLAIPVTE